MSFEIALVLLMSFLVGTTLGVRAGAATLLCLAGMAFIVLGTKPPPGGGIELPVDHQTPEMTTSTACRSCHPGQYESWHQSYHRTMTRPATPQTVNAQFEGELSHDGMKMRLFKDADGLWINGGQGPETIAMVTGSHHLESFWVRQEQGWFIQFPWVWLMAEQRWIPVEDSFLRPPSKTPPVPQVWNDSCIHCHNVASTRGPSPRETGQNAKVSELGIACEACHGGAETHSERLQNPLVRYAEHFDFTTSASATVFDPTASSQAATGAICAQCHGVFLYDEPRKRSDLKSAFRPGDDIDETRTYLKPQPTPLPGRDPMIASLIDAVGQLVWDAGASSQTVTITGMAPDGVHLSGELPKSTRATLFFRGIRIDGELTPYADGAHLGVNWSMSNWTAVAKGLGFTNQQPKPFDWYAFWRDGTVRTVGRETNGLLVSACATNGEMTCMSCHTMHGNEANDQLKPGMRGNLACVGCHEEIAANIEAHTHHGSESSGSECYNCHMPYTTYGLLTVSRAHRVDSPDPSGQWASGRPNACNLCHLDRTVQWAADATEKWYGQTIKRLPEDPRTLDAASLWLLAGDAAQRAVATWHLGWTPARDAARTKLWALPYLRQLLNDPYSAVRAIAGKSASNLYGEGQPPYDFIASEAQRLRAIKGLETSAKAAEPRIKQNDLERTIDPRTFSRLLDQRDERPVFIAE